MDVEAINIINRNPNPLSFYVFTGGKKEEEWLERIQFGTGCVTMRPGNLPIIACLLVALVRAGIGGYHGKHSFDLFTHKKAVMKTPYLV